MGAYVVAVGYFAAGWAGAMAAWLAMITPALVAIPLLAVVRRWMHLPRMRGVVDAVVIASAALLVVAAVALATDGLRQLLRVFGS